MDQRLCQLCGNPFTYTTTRRKYCSEICSNQGRRRKEGIYAQKRTGQTTKTKINDDQKRICQMIDAGTACIVNIDVPHKLSSWELFFESYNGGMGKTVKFVKHEDRWIKQKEIEDWSVEQWNTWYEGYKNVEDKTEAYYLMDVPLHTNHSRLLQNQNPLIDLFSYGGQYCFSRYVKMYSEDIPIPDLHYMAFIAPPWGQIMTYPHKDGHGTQLSVHCCVIGSGYNLVHCWPRLNMGQENDFRAILKIPPIGSKQEISHDIDYDKGVDGSITIWDVELAEELAKKGVDDPTKFELRPGQAIILPPNQYHSFKKIHTDQQATSMPLVGVACDCAYIGSTKEAFLDNYTSMRGLQNVHRWSDHVYCILELCLYCLFQSLVDADPSELKSDTTMIAHAHGAYKLFAAWVETEVNTEAMVREKYNIESPVEMMADIDEDLTCWKCKLPLVNLFCYTTDDHSKRYCIDCLTKSKKRTGLALMCRLKTPKLLQKLLTAAQSILNNSGSPMDDYTGDLNENEQTLNDNSSKKRKKSNNTPMASSKKLKTNLDTSNNPLTDSLM